MFGLNAGKKKRRKGKWEDEDESGFVWGGKTQDEDGGDASGGGEGGDGDEKPKKPTEKPNYGLSGASSERQGSAAAALLLRICLSAVGSAVRSSCPLFRSCAQLIFELLHWC